MKKIKYAIFCIFLKKEEEYEELFKPGAKKFHFPKYKNFSWKNIRKFLIFELGKFSPEIYEKFFKLGTRKFHFPKLKRFVFFGICTFSPEI